MSFLSPEAPFLFQTLFEEGESPRYQRIHLFIEGLEPICKLWLAQTLLLFLKLFNTGNQICYMWY